MLDSVIANAIVINVTVSKIGSSYESCLYDLVSIIVFDHALLTIIFQQLM